MKLLQSNSNLAMPALLGGVVLNRDREHGFHMRHPLEHLLIALAAMAMTSSLALAILVRFRRRVPKVSQPPA